MRLFDFFKSRKDSPRNLGPNTRRAVLRRKLEATQKQIANLRAVGREDDIIGVVSDYLQEIFLEWSHIPHNPEYLSLLAHASMILGAPEHGKEMLKIVIEDHKQYPSLDLTTVYMDLGRIYHKLGNNSEKELWHYHKATEIIPHKDCEFPASKKDKAKAHNFAHFCAARILNEEYANYHDRKRRELAPEVNWDDIAQITKWIHGGG